MPARTLRQQRRRLTPLVVPVLCGYLGQTLAASSGSDRSCGLEPRGLAAEQLLLQTRVGKVSASQHARVLEGAAPDLPIAGVVGYPAGLGHASAGLWCEVPTPPAEWSLKKCPFNNSDNPDQTLLTVLTYNLFWWNLFSLNRGGDRSAGRLLADTSFPGGYDLMGFQECDDINRVLADAKASGLPGNWAATNGGRGLALAYRADRFSLLAAGGEDVGEDDKSQHYGRRSAHWVRLRHMSGKNVLFVNHHGPLPVSFDGGCAGLSTADNILRVIAQHAHWEDAIVLVGDFNAQAWSSRIKELDKRLTRVFSGTAFGGVDHIFTNCPDGAVGHNLGPGHGTAGSDHDAVSVTLRF